MQKFGLMTIILGLKTNKQTNKTTHELAHTCNPNILKGETREFPGLYRMRSCLQRREGGRRMEEGRMKRGRKEGRRERGKVGFI